MTATVVGSFPGATEPTAAAILAAVDELEGISAAIRTAAEDGASEATLAAVLAAVDGLEGLLGRLPATGASTEATLAGIRAAAEAIQTSQEATEVAAEASAKETTAQGILSAVDQLEAIEAQIRDRLPAAGAASEAKLEAVRALAAGVGLESTQLLARAALEAIRDTVLRRTDPLSAGSNLVGYTSPSIALKAGLGRFFVATSGRVTLSLTGNLRAVVQNPSGSGKNLFIVRMAGLATATGWAQLFINPTTGVPTSAARPTLNAIVGAGVASVATMRVDTSTTTALSGGTDPGVTIGIGAGNRFAIDLPPLILAPGISLGINIPFAGAADAELALYWYEE